MPTSPLHRSGLLALASAVVLLSAEAPAEARRGERHGHAAKARSLKPKTGRHDPAPAEAPKASAAKTATAEAGEPAKTWTAGEPGEKSCQRSRRKLWQPGEGWMVKRVTICP